MGREPKRYLIIPDTDVDGADILACRATSDLTAQQYGPSVRQPTNGTPRAIGDIQPTLSGVPEDREAGGLRLSLAGPVEHARFGWLREGDDEDTDLQMRQSPMVCGRRPALVRTSPLSYINRPRLLPLRSGSLLMVWVESNKPSVREHEGPGEQALRWSRYDPATNRWTNYDSMTGPGGVNGPATAGADLGNQVSRVAVDVVQFPDTGEILAFVAVQKTNVGPDTRRIYTYHSTDDGATWVERSRAFAEGDFPDFELKYKHGANPEADDPSAIEDIAAELLDSGRVVLFVRTGRALTSLTSDDRGSTWAWNRVNDDDSAIPVEDGDPVGCFVSCGKMRNGRVIVMETAVGQSALPAYLARPRAYVTGDGVHFSSAIDIPEYNGRTLGFYGHAVTMRPDGWPAIYGCIHHFDDNPSGTGTVRFSDWLGHASLRTRDPGLTDTAATWFGSPGVRAFHIVESPNSDGIGGSSADAQWLYDGFAAVDAVCYRGQVVLAASYVHETGTLESPALGFSSLMVYRLNHWQPLQERLGIAPGPPFYYNINPPVGARAYNVTWDCYGLPTDCGWSSVGAASADIVPGTAEDGYLQIEGNSNARYFANDLIVFPIDIANLTQRTAAFRFVARAEQGGSLMGNAISFFLRLYQVGIPMIGQAAGSVIVIVRLERGATHTKVALVDGVNDDQIGTEVLVPNDRWIEVVGAVVDTDAVAYVRSDPGEADWDEPYTLIASGTLMTENVANEGVAFGHLISGDDESWWKTVQVHRILADFPSNLPLAQRGIDHYDDATTHDIQTTGGQGVSGNDHGIANVMRTSQATSVPRQYLTGGVSVAWRGEAKVEGVYDYATGYDYPVESTLIEPVAKEWRSAETGKEVEIILDAGANRRFRPVAAAMIGRNFPACTLQMNTSNSWGAPLVNVSWGWAGGGATVDRYTHAWAWDAASGWSYSVSIGRVVVYAPGGAGPWRPHQFRSQKTGPRFYWVINHGGSSLSVGTWRAYRIRDNTEDTLLLETVPALADVAFIGESGARFSYPWAIYSDRFAALFDHVMDNYSLTISGITMPNGHGVAWRYMRLLIPAVTHMDADEQFLRLGRLVLGRALELHTPGPQWGWRVEQESGVDVTDTDSGATYARRRHSPRRTWSFDYAHMLPATEASDVLRSPASQPTRRSWQEWVDAVRSLEVDGRPCALVWEGDRAVGSLTEDTVQLPTDPTDVMMVRVTSAGTVEHTGYEDRGLNLAAGETCVPRPVCMVRGVTLREEF